MTAFNLMNLGNIGFTLVHGIKDNNYNWINKKRDNFKDLKLWGRVNLWILYG